MSKFYSLDACFEPAPSTCWRSISGGQGLAASRHPSGFGASVTGDRVGRVDGRRHTVVKAHNNQAKIIPKIDLS
ncbi:MAG: hypothetical protein OER04_11620 [Cyclobacteriaceae bacterium]|nr:hypothetical protein [Cyclobacteriaceae bacterium]